MMRRLTIRRTNTLIDRTWTCPDTMRCSRTTAGHSPTRPKRSPTLPRQAWRTPSHSKSSDEKMSRVHHLLVGGVQGVGSPSKGLLTSESGQSAGIRFGLAHLPARPFWMQRSHHSTHHLPVLYPVGNGGDLEQQHHHHHHLVVFPSHRNVAVRTTPSPILQS